MPKRSSSQKSSDQSQTTGESAPDLFAGLDFDFSIPVVQEARANHESETKSTSVEKAPTKRHESYRVIHTADWHLGKTLCDLSREEEHDRFLSFLLRTIQEHEVDALIIAGDVFDSSNPPQSALRRYYNFLSDLYRATSCDVVVIAGNHDSPMVLEAPRDILDPLRVRVIGEIRERADEMLIPLPNADDPQLLVAAVPFLRERDVRVGQAGQTQSDIREALREGIQKRYDEVADAALEIAETGVPVLATGHLTVSGATVSESEREIHIGGLGKVGAEIFHDLFCYVALGHLHRPQSTGSKNHVRYSGSPIPLSFSEALDEKELRMLDFSAGGLQKSQSIVIPIERRIVQIRCSRNDLETTLGNFEPPPSNLTPWVEIVVEDPVSGENLFEIVRDLVGEIQNYSVVRVLGQRTGEWGGLSDGGDAATGADDDLLYSSILEDPSAVFRERLAREHTLTDQEKESLETVFRELCELHAENLRGEGASVS